MTVGVLPPEIADACTAAVWACGITGVVTFKAWYTMVPDGVNVALVAFAKP